MPRFGQRCTVCTWVDEIIVPSGVNPPCPDCGGVTERLWTAVHGTTTQAIGRDEIPGGLTLYNLGPEPITVYSHSERLRLAKERGLREMIRAGDSPEGRLVNWDVPSPYTLEEAAKLVERVEREGKYRSDPKIDPVNVTFNVRNRGFFTGKDAEK